MRMFFYLMVLQCVFFIPVMASDFNQIELTDFRTNKAVNLSEFDKTKPTYIKLWATWCKTMYGTNAALSKSSKKIRRQNKYPCS